VPVAAQAGVEAIGHEPVEVAGRDGDGRKFMDRVHLGTSQHGRPAQACPSEDGSGEAHASSAERILNVRISLTITANGDASTAVFARNSIKRAAVK